MENEELEEDLPVNIDGKVPQRDRQINIWKSDILFYERIRRENGASIIGIRIERGVMADIDKIMDHFIDALSPDDLCTKWSEELILLGTWGKDLNELFKKCHYFTDQIPENKVGTKLFKLYYSLIMGIPFEELHYRDTLDQVLHRVFSLLDNEHISPVNIPYDHFLDMEKTEAQMNRMKTSVVKKASSSKRRENLGDDDRRLF